MRCQNCDSDGDRRLFGSCPRFLVPRLLQEQGWTDLRANLKSHRKNLLPLGSVIREVTALPGFHLNITVALRRSGFFFFLSGVSGMLFLPVNSALVKVGSGLQSPTAQRR